MAYEQKIYIAHILEAVWDQGFIQLFGISS